MSYSVEDTRQVNTITQSGSKRIVYRVWIVTGNGATGQVDVPADKWNETDLPVILAELAEELDLAFNL